jgi:hypothetical protein
MCIRETLLPTGPEIGGAPVRRGPLVPGAQRALVAILLAGALASGCGRGDDAARSEERLSTDVEALCAQKGEERVSSGALYDSAAAYAARGLEDAGLVPVVMDSEGAPGFIQPVPLVRNLVGDDTWMELTIGRKTKRLPEGRRTFLLLAPGEADRVMEARPPVFVGNALRAPEYGVDDFAGLDLEGRGVLVTATPPDSEALARYPEPVRDMYRDPGEAQSRRMRDIVERGAAAILLLPDRWMVDEWDVVSTLGSRPVYRPTEPYPGHVLRSPVPVALLHADLVDRLFLGRAYHPISHVGRYRTFELQDLTLRLDIDARREPLVTANVVGVVPGSDRSLRDEYVVVSAQLDGGESDDNGGLASWDAPACATVLEAARMIARKPPKRSVLFVVFIGEEGGIWGSLHLLSHPPVPREAIFASVHIGTGEVSGTDVLSLQVLASPPALAREIKNTAERGEVDLRAISEEIGPFRGTPSEIFVDAGIPSVLVTMGNEWQTQAACRDRLEAGCLLEAARKLRALIDETANARKLKEEPDAKPGKEVGR